MIDLFRQLKLDYQDFLLIIKSGNFYVLFDEDAIIMNKLFGFKINDLKNNIKVGFPVNSIDKYINMLKELEINYLIIENMEIVDESINDNNSFNDYKESVFEYISINNKIDNIVEYVKNIDDKNVKIELVHKIEEIIKMYQ